MTDNELDSLHISFINVFLSHITQRFSGLKKQRRQNSVLICFQNILDSVTNWWDSGPRQGRERLNLSVPSTDDGEGPALWTFK